MPALVLSPFARARVRLIDWFQVSCATRRWQQQTAVHTPPTHSNPSAALRLASSACGLLIPTALSVFQHHFLPLWNLVGTTTLLFFFLTHFFFIAFSQERARSFVFSFVSSPPRAAAQVSRMPPQTREGGGAPRTAPRALFFFRRLLFFPSLFFFWFSLPSPRALRGRPCAAAMVCTGRRGWPVPMTAQRRRMRRRRRIDTHTRAPDRLPAVMWPVRPRAPASQ